MWLMTTRGFFSVVEHREDDNILLIRARCKQDIEALADLVALSAAAVAAGRDADLLPLWRATAAAVAGDEVATQGAVRMARAALREGLSAPIVDIAAGLDPAPALAEALAR